MHAPNVLDLLVALRPRAAELLMRAGILPAAHGRAHRDICVKRLRGARQRVSDHQVHLSARALERRVNI